MSCLDGERHGSKPIILLLGEIVLAHQEWDALGAIAELRQVRQGPRTQFLRDLENGVYNGVVAISRTWDSTEFTGRFDQALVSLLPITLKSISHNGAGYDSIDAAACAARGIAVSNTPGAVDASTASVAIWLMLGALRRAHVPYTATRAGNWRGGMKLTHDPENKVLGILGMGGIGTAMAKRAVPFGMSIQYHNRHEVSKERNTVGAKYVGIEALLRTSDVISIHLPLNEGTRGMIGRKELAMMKDGVVIVNTARGPIIEETALVEALESGKVWGAGLDVYEREPIVHEGLLRNDHCVLMPHVGTASFETQRKMEELVIKNLRAIITEGKLLTPVAESQVLTMTTSTVNGAAAGTAAAELAGTTATTTNDTMRKQGTETETLAQKLESTAAAVLAASNVAKDGISLPKAIPSAAATPNGVTSSNTTTMTDGLWEPPKSPLKAQTMTTNWLELSPPLRPKEKYPMLEKGENTELQHRHDMHALHDGSLGGDFAMSRGGAPTLAAAGIKY